MIVLNEMLTRNGSLEGYFWFDDPASATDDEIRQIRERGALTIACVNNFRYPAHSFNQLEETDIKRMENCNVDGYQIDSQYGYFFEKLDIESPFGSHVITGGGANESTIT